MKNKHTDAFSMYRALTVICLLVILVVSLNVLARTEDTEAHNVEYVGHNDSMSDARGVTVVGNYAYVADWYDGLIVLNISNPVNPTKTGFYDTPGRAYAVTVADNYAYVADGWGGLRVIDIGNPASPMEIGVFDTFGNAKDVAVVGTYAYVADAEGGLRIIDISNPASLTEVGFHVTFGDVQGVSIAGNYAYLADGVGGLRVIDINNPTSPTETGSFDTPGGYFGSVTVVDNFAYVTDGDRISGGLRVIDISNPALPIEVGFFSLPDYDAYDVAVMGDFAYVVELYRGLRVVDISDPASPTEVGFYDTSGYARGVVVADNYTYVADGDGGVLILQFQPPPSSTFLPLVLNEFPTCITVDQEPNDSIQQANRLLCSGVTVEGILSPGAIDRHDFFAFTIDTAHALEVYLTHIPREQDYDLTLRRSDGAVIANSAQFGDSDESIRLDTIPPGTYYVDVIKQSNGSSQPYHLTAVYE